MKTSIKTNYHPPLSFRAVGITQRRLEDLKKRWGTNRSNVIARCIDLAWSEELGSQHAEATKASESKRLINKKK